MPTQQGACAHHWRIDAPQGAESRALCLKCGAERTFSNSETPRMSFSRRPVKPEPQRGT